MKRIIPIILFISIFLLEPGCKKVIDDIVNDIIDCTVESAYLSIHADADTTNTKLVHFEFVNTDTEEKFTLDSEINWDFGDGGAITSNNHKTEHTYATAGDYKVTAAYTLRRGSATCTSTKEKNITVN